MKTSQWIGLTSVVCLLLITFMVWTWIHGNARQQRVDVANSGDATTDKVPAVRRIPAENEIEVGGVIRPRQDVEGPDREAQNGDNRNPIVNVGHTPLVDPKKNLAAKKILEAIQDESRNLAYRLTPFLPAPEFDRQEYETDPEAYLSDIAPGRIFDVLPYSEKTARIRRASAPRTRVLQGETVVLKAQTEPKMPVSFYSSRFGRFNGGLSAITVAADAQGIAEVNFETTPGMSGDVDVVATSPVRSGRARYLVEVDLPSRTPQSN